MVAPIHTIARSASKLIFKLSTLLSKNCYHDVFIQSILDASSPNTDILTLDQSNVRTKSEEINKIEKIIGYDSAM